MRVLEGAPGPADLLVIRDRRAGRLVVDDEREVGLVVPHSQRRGGDEHLQVVGEQAVLEVVAQGRVGVAAVRRGVDAVTGEPAGDPLAVGHGEAVHDPGPRQGRDHRREPGEPIGLARHAQGVEHQARAGEGSPDGADARPELRFDVGHDPVVRGGGGAENGDIDGEQREDRCHAAVVGPEIVAPVADAVHFVDDEQADAWGEGRQHRLPERGVGEPLGRDEQHVDLVAVEAVRDVVPLFPVVAVDGGGADPTAFARGDLVAHQGEERRDDHRRSGAAVAQEPGGDEIHRALPPAGALDHEHPGPVEDERRDRLELARPELGGGRGDEFPEGGAGFGGEGLVDHPADRTGGVRHESVEGHIGPSDVPPGCGSHLPALVA